MSWDVSTKVDVGLVGASGLICVLSNHLNGSLSRRVIALAIATVSQLIIGRMRYFFTSPSWRKTIEVIILTMSYSATFCGCFILFGPRKGLWDLLAINLFTVGCKVAVWGVHTLLGHLGKLRTSYTPAVFAEMDEVVFDRVVNGMDAGQLAKSPAKTKEIILSRTVHSERESIRGDITLEELLELDLSAISNKINPLLRALECSDKEFLQLLSFFQSEKCPFPQGDLAWQSLISNRLSKMVRKDLKEFLKEFKTRGQEVGLVSTDGPARNWKDFFLQMAKEVLRRGKLQLQAAEVIDIVSILGDDSFLEAFKNYSGPVENRKFLLTHACREIDFPKLCGSDLEAQEEDYSLKDFFAFALCDDQGEDGIPTPNPVLIEYFDHSVNSNDTVTQSQLQW